MTYLGLDPGVNGGIAAVAADGTLVSACRIPDTERDLMDVVEALPIPACATLERVRSSPQMGVVSAFTFGMGYGGLRMALTAARIPFEEVTPFKWQSALGCLTKGDKNVSKRKAQELWPSHKITHAIADALLLAEYGRRLKMGQGA